MVVDQFYINLEEKRKREKEKGGREEVSKGGEKEGRQAGREGEREPQTLRQTMYQNQRKSDRPKCKTIQNFLNKENFEVKNFLRYYTKGTNT